MSELELGLVAGPGQEIKLYSITKFHKRITTLWGGKYALKDTFQYLNENVPCILLLTL